MGRPLNKKYFGNRNIGTGSTNPRDDHIGGEGIASFTLTNQGSYRIALGNAAPTFSIGTPDITGGIQATAAVVWEVDSLVVTNGVTGTGYSNAVCTLTGLTSATSVPLTIAIASNGSGVHEPQSFNITSRGEWTTPPTVAATYQVAQGGSNGLSQVAVYYRIKSYTPVNSGSGYVTTPAVSVTGGTLGTQAVINSVLTIDSGNVGSTTYQENAIMAVAATTGATPRSNSDIVKQQGSQAYYVKNADGTALCRLVAKTPDTAGTMAIAAVDSDGGTYWVTKLTARKARLTANSGTQFATGKVVPWTMNGTNGTKVYATQPYLAAGVNVKITNA